MKTLEQHKQTFKEMMPVSGFYREMSEIAGLPDLDEFLKRCYLAQTERDVRRLALHRVEEAIDDLSKDELKLFIAFLIQASKDRQDVYEKGTKPMSDALVMTIAIERNPERLELFKKMYRLMGFAKQLGIKNLGF